MKVSVEVPDEEMRDITREEIIEAVAEQVVVTDGDKGAIQAACRDKVRLLAMEWIKDNLDLEAMTFRQTNSWGEAQGPEQTFREHLAFIAQGVLQERVGYDGRTATATSTSGLSFSEWVIRKYVKDFAETQIRDAAKAALPAAADQIGDTIKAAVREKLGLPRKK